MKKGDSKKNFLAHFGIGSNISENKIPGQQTAQSFGRNLYSIATKLLVNCSLFCLLFCSAL